MKNNPILDIDIKKLKEPDYMLYAESLSLDNLNEGVMSSIVSNYKTIRQASEKIISNYIPNFIIFSAKNNSLNKIDDFLISPPIQPHDAYLTSIVSDEQKQSINIKGIGNSYIDHNTYEFNLSFGGADFSIVKEQKYNQGILISSSSYSLNNSSTLLSKRNLREVFLSRDSKLKNEVNFYSIEMDFEGNVDNGERTVKVLSISFDKVDLSYKPLKKKKLSY